MIAELLEKRALHAFENSKKGEKNAFGENKTIKYE